MRSGNYQRTPLGESLPRIALEAVQTALQQNGKALPCSVVAVSGQFVTVKFEVTASPPFTLPNITIPINTSQYDWLPVQVGDKGYAQSADVPLANVSGITTAIPQLVQCGNLTGLAFQPVANKAWTAANSNQRVVQGPAGVLLQPIGEAVSVNITTSSITLTAGGHTIVISSAGIVLDGIVWGTHEHTNVQTGSSKSGPPTSP